MTDMRKAANTIAFGVEAQQDFRDSGEGMGLLGKAKLKYQMKTDQKIFKKDKTGQGSSMGFDRGFTLSAPSESSQIKPAQKKSYFDS